MEFFQTIWSSILNFFTMVGEWFMGVFATISAFFAGDGFNNAVLTVSAFLLSTVPLFGVEIPWWAIIAAAAALLVIILVIVIAVSVSCAKKKKAAKAAEEEANKPVMAIEIDDEEPVVAEEVPVVEEAPVEAKPLANKEETPVEETAEEPVAEPVAEEEPVEEATEAPAEEPAEEPVVEEAVEETAEEPVAEPVAEEPVADTAEEDEAAKAAEEEARKAEEEAAKKAAAAEKRKKAAEARKAKKAAEEEAARKAAEEEARKAEEEAAKKAAAAEKRKQAAEERKAKKAAEIAAAAAVAAPAAESAVKAPRYSGKWVLTKATVENEEGEHYFFELRASNGQKLLTSWEYNSYQGALRGIETYKTNIEKGNFRVYETKKGEFFFKLLTGKNTLLGTGANYPTKEGCTKTIESVKRFAPTAIVDEKVEEIVYKANEESDFTETVEQVDEGYVGKWIINLTKGEDDKEIYTFELYANNGQLLLSSEEYSSFVGVINGISTHKANIQKGNFSIQMTKKKEWFFLLLNGNKQPLCLGEHYKAKTRCESAVESVKRFAPNAPIFFNGKEVNA